MNKRLYSILLIVFVLFMYIDLGVSAALKNNVAANSITKSASAHSIATIHAIYSEGNHIFIRADKQLKASYFRLTKPERIVLNIPNAKLENTFNHPIFVQDNHPMFKTIRYSNFSNQPPTVRVVADLSAQDRTNLPFEINSPTEQELILSVDQQLPTLETDENSRISPPVAPAAVPAISPISAPEIVEDLDSEAHIDSNNAETESQVDLESVLLGNFDLILRFNRSIDLQSEWPNRNELLLNLNRVRLDNSIREKLTPLLEGKRTLKNQSSFELTTSDNKQNHQLKVISKNGFVPVLFSNEDQTKWTIRAKNDTVRVIIDAGHGGIDVGATSIRKNYEKDFTLDMAKRLYEELLNVSGIVPVLTRADDRFISLDKRSQFAKNNHGDLFISIHANSNERKSIHGTETYYADDRGKEMASYYHADLVKATGFKDRSIRKAKFIVLRNNSVPSILIEVGYYSNANDEAQMNKDSFRERVAKSIANSTKKYVNERLAP